MSPVSTPVDFEEFQRSAIEIGIAECFRRRVVRHPDRLAVKTSAASLSYRELDLQANRVAQALLASRGDRAEPVAIVVEQGPALIAAILGVLKAGKFYVPLEAGQPRDRFAHMLDDSSAKVAIASASMVAAVRNMARPDVAILVAEQLGEASSAAADPRIDIAADAHAYIYYTTGSTGQPKGVLDSHRNVLHNVMRYTNGLRIAGSDRLTLLQSPSFSGAVSSMFAALLNGAALFPFDVRGSSAQQLADYVALERITIYHSVPSIFRSFLHGERRFPSVRVIRLEGDQSTALDVELFRRHFSADCVLANGLGTTETGIVRRYLLRQQDHHADRIVPVGYPVEDMEVVVLDDGGEPVPCGAVGEIAVRSAYLACGYWNLPQATERAFISRPDDPALRLYRTGDMGRLRSDGCLEHLGRMDSRTKIRGVTVALAEVEAALQSMTTIREAVVVERDDRGTERRLAAYYVAEAGCDPTTSELRRQLAALLSPQMIPSVFVRLDRLPLNENLKIDRSQLPAPARQRPRLDVPYLAARDPTESQLVRVWEDLLECAPVGIRDDFFDLGGDSLLATQMGVAAEGELGFELPPLMMFADFTIERIVEYLRKSATVSPSIVPLVAGGSRPRFFFLHGDYLGGGLYCRALARGMAADQPFLSLTPCGLDGSPAPATIEEMAARHLRALRSVQPQGPYRLGGNCNGGLIALEMAQQLAGAGESVEHLILIRTSVRNVRHAALHQLVDGWGSWLGLSRQLRITALRHLRWFADAWSRGSLTDRMSLLMAKATAALRWAAHRFGRRASRSAGAVVGGPASPADRDTLITTYMQAAADYVPRRYAGPVVVLWPEGEPERVEDARRWWREVSPLAEVQLVPGDHLSAITVHAQSLAAAIGARLSKQPGRLQATLNP